MIRLTNGQWERIRNHFPEEHMPDGRPGRKPIPTRRVFEAVLWILNTGAQWHMLPQSYPNYKSVHRRFQTWCRDEVLLPFPRFVGPICAPPPFAVTNVAIDEAFRFTQGAFVAKLVGYIHQHSPMKIMAIVDHHGLPLSVSTHAANHHEVRLVQLCFDFYMIEAKPENLIGDRATLSGLGSSASATLPRSNFGLAKFSVRTRGMISCLSSMGARFRKFGCGPVSTDDFSRTRTSAQAGLACS